MIIDGGTGYDGKGPEAKPGGYAKDVILRVDRADGFVGRNFLARGALEHGIYIEETDGYLLDRVKFFWAADYGNLTFTSDHGLYKNCDGFGSGDSVVYPGAAPETGEQADKSFYPDAPRINTVVKKCDMRGSALAYSGSMGNAVRITKQPHLRQRRPGISTDTISASGHPGFPADSVGDRPQLHLLEQPQPLHRRRPMPPVEPIVGVPIGVGIVWPGMNNGECPRQLDLRQLALRRRCCCSSPTRSSTPGGRRRRRASPVRPPAATRPRATTSYHDNHMGQRPPGLQVPARRVGRFGIPHATLAERCPTASTSGGTRSPTHGQLLVRQHRLRRHRGQRHRSRRRRAAGHAAQPTALQHRRRRHA